MALHTTLQVTRCNMEVIATETGFYGGKLRFEGDKFKCEDSEPSSWMEVVEVEAKPEPKKKA